MLSCNDWWMVFDSEVPCFCLLNKRGIPPALLDPCGMIQTKRPIKSHHNSPLGDHRAFLATFIMEILFRFRRGLPLVLQRCRRIFLKALPMRAFAWFV